MFSFEDNNLILVSDEIQLASFFSKFLERKHLVADLDEGEKENGRHIFRRVLSGSCHIKRICETQTDPNTLSKLIEDV